MNLSIIERERASHGIEERGFSGAIHAEDDDK